MRIFLRALEPEDFKLTHSWRVDNEIADLIGGNRYYVSKEREKQWVESKSLNDKEGIYLAICLKEKKQMIGYCSIINLDLRNQKAELGGTIIGNREHQGKGYGSEAQQLMMRYCFLELPIHKVYGFALQEHKITEKMMLSLGFKIDGILKDEVYKNGEFKSLNIFSILRDEYFAKYGSRTQKE